MCTNDLDKDLKTTVHTILTSQFDDLTLLLLLAEWQLLAARDRNLDLVSEWSRQRSEVTHRLAMYHRQLLCLFHQHAVLRVEVSYNSIASKSRQLVSKIQNLDEQTLGYLVAERKTILNEKTQFDQTQTQLNRFANPNGAKSIAMDRKV